MGDFNKGKRFGGRSGGGRSFGGDRGGRGFGGGRDRERPEMHKAVCSNCGNNCEVPFRPTGDKPVFCSDCFKNKSQDSRGGENRGFGDRNSRPSFTGRNDRGGKEAPDYKAQFEMLNSKLDKIIKIINQDVTEEVEKMVSVSESKKISKRPNKDINITALKQALTNSKATEKEKVVGKKVVSEKKSAENKKVVVKKVVEKKKPVVKKKKI